MLKHDGSVGCPDIPQYIFSNFVIDLWEKNIIVR